ncbi:MAG: hypothetical protein ACXWEY_16265 [Bacteroidia bacterium]
MKYLLILSLATCFAFGSCNNTPKEEAQDDKDTTVVIHEYEKAPEPAAKTQDEAKPKPEEKPEPPKEVKKDWRPLMEEYHEVLCRRHKGNPEPNDGIRQVELTKELNDARKELPKDEQFSFTTAMARAANMESCK